MHHICMKQCSRCREWKSRTEFFFKNKKAGRIGNACRDCGRLYCQEYYRRWRAEYLRRKRHLSALRRQRNRDFVMAYLATHPCVDCGEHDPIVLEFDHVRGDKVKEVSILLHETVRIENLANEIGKCVVRCANCHRRKTSLERGWFKSRRAAGLEQDYPTGRSSAW